MKNRLAARRTNLNPRELALILENLNHLNFPVPQQTRPDNITSGERSNPPIFHAYLDAKQANRHGLQ